MSNPTFIQCSIILPGAPFHEALSEDCSSNDDMGAYIENEALGERIYSVTRNKMVCLAESSFNREPLVKLDDEHRLDETLFVVTQITEICPRGGWNRHEWLADYMAEGSWEDLNEGNMKALYDIAMKHIGQDGLNDPFTREHFHVGASFVVDWTISHPRITGPDIVRLTRLM